MCASSSVFISIFSIHKLRKIKLCIIMQAIFLFPLIFSSLNKSKVQNQKDKLKIKICIHPKQINTKR